MLRNNSWTIILSSREGIIHYQCPRFDFLLFAVLDQSEMRTRERKECQSMRTIWDVCRDDRAVIATFRLRTATDRFKESSVDDLNCFHFFLTGLSHHIIFTEHLTCSFLIVSSYVTPHIHSICYMVIYVSSLLPSLTYFCRTIFHCTSSNSHMLQSPYVLSPYPCIPPFSSTMLSPDT